MMQDRFNRKYHYPYVFLNDEEFSDDFKKFTSGVASAKCTYGLIPHEQWGDSPAWIDEGKAAGLREQMEKANVIYGGSLSYRKMCRYQSGFFWRHPLLDTYEYYWRIESVLLAPTPFSRILVEWMTDDLLRQAGSQILLQHRLRPFPAHVGRKEEIRIRRDDFRIRRNNRYALGRDEEYVRSFLPLPWWNF